MMNKKLSLLIADDEMLARHLLKEFLRAHPDCEIVGEVDNGDDAIHFIQTHQPDLVLLDIQMPEYTGLEVLQITGRQHGVIFTTAYDQYALQAFDQHAVDYLLKPFSQARFDQALDKARRLALTRETVSAQEERASSGLDKLIQQQIQSQQKILLKERGTPIAIELNSISHVIAEDDYITIVAGDKRHMKTQSLSDFEKQLPDGMFIRIHRAYLARVDAIDQIEKVSKDRQEALLHDGTRLPISRSGLERWEERQANQGH